MSAGVKIGGLIDLTYKGVRKPLFGILFNPSDSAIIAIINSITGETDTTYIAAMAELTTQIGGTATGVIDTDVSEILAVMGTNLA